MKSSDAFREGRPVAVDFTAIEKELSGLWSAASTAAAERGAPAVMRACQLNLVALCRGQEEVERASRLISKVAAEHPSRVLMALDDESPGGDLLQASISAQCSWEPGVGPGRQICCEQINITARGGPAQRLPATVLPLLLPDLPVILWWAGQPRFSSAIDRGLIQSADRVIVDSARFADPAAQLPGLAGVDGAVSDFAWHRLRGWRELTAGLFDAGVLEGYPQKLDTIEVEFAHEDDACGARCEALLLGAWAASRLGWKRAGPPADGTDTEPSRDHPMVRPSGEAAALRLAGVKGAETPGCVRRFTLSAPGATFALRRAASGDCVVAAITMPGTCSIPRTARVPERDEATLLSRCLGETARDDIYREALGLAASLATCPPQGRPA